MELIDFNLNTNPNLSILHFDNEEDWLEIRRKGIGGSDIGAIMGLNKYTSPLKIYKQKVEDYHEDLSSNINVKKGKALEDYILENYVLPDVKSKGFTVGKPDFMIINSKMPWLRANLDGLAYNEIDRSYRKNFVVEIKYVSEYAEVNWNGPDYGGVPASYYAQVQLYMAVTDTKYALLYALFDSEWEVHRFKIPRNDSFIAEMLRVSKAFYDYNMCMKIPPKVHTALDKEDVVNIIKKTPIPKTPSSEMSDLVRQYKNVNDSIKALTKEKDILNDQILEYYANDKCPDDPKLSVKLSVVKSSKFNQTRFKNDHPEMYDQYCEDSESSRFTIK